MLRKNTPETIFIAPNVIDRIKRNALQYPEDETGEALIGVMMPAGRQKFPETHILETIPPGQDAIRRWAMFEQGNDWQFYAFTWLNENWEVYRTMRRRTHSKSISEKWDLPLLHVGDWHKQPGGMIKPSGGDLQTAKALLRDDDYPLNYLVAPIVTFAEDARDEPAENTLIFEDTNPALRIDFWGLSLKSRWFLPLKPIIERAYGLPQLPDMAWWLRDEARFNAELDSLTQDGLDISRIVQHNADGKPPLETCFLLYRPGTYHVVIGVTPHNYPKSPPTWRTAPIKRPAAEDDLFTALYADSQVVPEQITHSWSGDRDALLDGLRLVEDYLKENPYELGSR